MRRLTVSSLFPRGDHLEEDEEESQLIVSFGTRHVCKRAYRPREGDVSAFIIWEKKKRLMVAGWTRVFCHFKVGSRSGILSDSSPLIRKREQGAAGIDNKQVTHALFSDPDFPFSLHWIALFICLHFTSADSGRLIPPSANGADNLSQSLKVLRQQSAEVAAAGDATRKGMWTAALMSGRTPRLAPNPLPSFPLPAVISFFLLPFLDSLSLPFNITVVSPPPTPFLLGHGWLPPLLEFVSKNKMWDP